MEDCEQKARRLINGESPDHVFAEQPEETNRIAA
jgi:hypothetical protein